MVQDVQGDPLDSSEGPGTVARGLLGIFLMSLRGCGAVTTEKRGEGENGGWKEELLGLGVDRWVNSSGKVWKHLVRVAGRPTWPALLPLHSGWAVGARPWCPSR